ncbi:MAG TPA: hypothetical protein VE954_07760 [Oligoflexus sp.]|uniref:hypothetical protein n=1 Tax=Oligoflexus sp. TaxID=1971216 RepID=UPI002D62B870|nr:hypothetical protein [Oligoflexus sp.]HYX32996.1 hypothetical protein [Oligoflexus sp.]
MIVRIRFLVGLLLALCPPVPSVFGETFQAANGPGAIGETGNLYLLDQGFFGRPLYNDVFGKTDKQLTGASQLGYLKMWSDSSLEVRTHWRFITPSFKEKFNGDKLSSPVGRYADWMELQTSWAKVMTFAGTRVRWQLSMGIGDIGNHGAKQVHRQIHRWVGSTLEGLDYSDQPTGRDISLGIEGGFIPKEIKLFGENFETLANVGVFRNCFMSELYFNYNVVKTFSQDWRMAWEVRMPYQVQSDVYKESARRERYEMALSTRYKWYRPSIKYVSPYLIGDNVGQIYVDPVAFFISW